MSSSISRFYRKYRTQPIKMSLAPRMDASITYLYRIDQLLFVYTLLITSLRIN